MNSADKALVGVVRKRAASKWGAAWHLLSAEVREAIVKAEALDLIASQVDVEVPMTTFAQAVLESIGSNPP